MILVGLIDFWKNLRLTKNLKITDKGIYIKCSGLHTASEDLYGIFSHSHLRFIRNTTLYDFLNCGCLPKV